MDDTLPALIEARYDPVLEQRRLGREMEWLVGSGAPEPIDVDRFVAELRGVFMVLDQMVDAYAGDPVATGQALARVDTLLADVRMVRDRLATETALAMRDLRVKRLVIESIAVLERYSSIRRTGWRHAELMRVLLRTLRVRLLDETTGELLDADEATTLLLTYITPTWKMTGLRDRGIEPDEFCEVDADDEGRPLSTPSVSLRDNRVRSGR